MLPVSRLALRHSVVTDILEAHHSSHGKPTTSRALWTPLSTTLKVHLDQRFDDFVARKASLSATPGAVDKWLDELEQENIARCSYGRWLQEYEYLRQYCKLEPVPQMDQY